MMSEAKPSVEAPRKISQPSAIPQCELQLRPYSMDSPVVKLLD